MFWINTETLIVVFTEQFDNIALVDLSWGENQNISISSINLLDVPKFIITNYFCYNTIETLFVESSEKQIYESKQNNYFIVSCLKNLWAIKPFVKNVDKTKIFEAIKIDFNDYSEVMFIYVRL